MPLLPIPPELIKIAKAVENYNIHKDLTNLFFFELRDDIFLTSSTDTDYYKLIKLSLSTFSNC